MSALRRAPCRPRRALDRDARAADPGTAARIHADGRRRRAPGHEPAGEPGTAAPRLTRCHDRSVLLVRPRLARHHPCRLARRPLAAGQRARPPPRRSSPPAASAPTSMPTSLALRAATRAMPTPARPTRLHADPARRGPPPFGRLAPLRGDPRDVARRAQPAAGRRAHDARPGRPARGHAPVLLDGQRGARPPAVRRRQSAAPGSTAGDGTDPRCIGGGRSGRLGRAGCARARSTAPDRPAIPRQQPRPPGVPGFAAGATPAPDTEERDAIGSSKGQGGAPGRRTLRCTRAISSLAQDDRRRLTAGHPVARVPDRRAGPVRPALDRAALRRR